MAEYTAKFRLVRKSLGSWASSWNQQRLSLDQLETEEVESEPFQAISDSAAIDFAEAQLKFIAPLRHFEGGEVLEIREGNRIIWSLQTH